MVYKNNGYTYPYVLSLLTLLILEIMGLFSSKHPRSLTRDWNPGHGLMKVRYWHGCVLAHWFRGWAFARDRRCWVWILSAVLWMLTVEEFRIRTKSPFNTSGFSMIVYFRSTRDFDCENTTISISPCTENFIKFITEWTYASKWQT